LRAHRVDNGARYHHLLLFGEGDVHGFVGGDELAKVGVADVAVCGSAAAAEDVVGVGGGDVF